MNVFEVATLFLSYVDEPDETFLSTAQAQLYLKLGYDAFRHLVVQYDPGTYEQLVQWQLGSAVEYDFALAANPVRLLGNPVGGLTGPRLQTICELTLRYTSQMPYGMMPMIGVKSLAEIAQGTLGTYLFTGTKLVFPYSMNGTMQMRYVGASAVDWTKTGPTDDEKIDDLEQFHELIAIFAAQKYNIRDAAANAQLQATKAELTERIEEYLCLGRDQRGMQRMAMTYTP